MRHLHVRSKSVTTAVIVLLFALCAPGCATRRSPLWYIEGPLVEVSSATDIEARFRAFFPRESDASTRFSTEEISAGKARFLFVTAFPYRGPALCSVYGYEQIKFDVWRLRAVIPIVKWRTTPPVHFEVDGDSVNVTHDGMVVLRLESIAITDQ